MTVLAIGGALAVAGVLMLIAFGLRAGDRAGELRLVAVTPQLRTSATRGGPVARRELAVRIANPGDATVLVGLSLRRRGLRLLLEGGAYVQVPTRVRRDLLAGRQAAVGAVAPRRTATFVLSVDGARAGRAELVVIAGERERLRCIHRSVTLPRADTAADGLQSTERAVTRARA
jgi:hypothetical protein